MSSVFTTQKTDKWTMTKTFIGMATPHHISDWCGGCHTASSTTASKYLNVSVQAFSAPNTVESNGH